MPRLLRPNIPLDVQLLVALRQLGDAAPELDVRAAVKRRVCGKALKAALVRLRVALGAAPDARLDLDHDPPLGARQKVYDAAGVHVEYIPAANDPEHLVWRVYVDHKVKTNVRGEHGQHPDRVLIKKNRQLEEREAGASVSRPEPRRPKRKQKIVGKTFAQQRCRLGVGCKCVGSRRKGCENYRPTNWGKKST